MLKAILDSDTTEELNMLIKYNYSVNKEHSKPLTYLLLNGVLMFKPYQDLLLIWLSIPVFWNLMIVLCP